MNKKKIALLTIAIVTGIAGIFYAVGALKPDRPKSVAGPLVIPPYDSSIDIPVSVTIQRIQETLEASAPKNLGGRINVDIGGNVSGEHVNWSAKRSAIRVTEEGGAILLTTAVNGDATLHWKYCPGGKMLPCKNGRQSVDIGANISIRVSDIHLTQDWKLSAKVVPTVDVKKAEGKVFNLVKVTFKSDLEDAIKDSLPKVQQAFGDVLAQLKIREQLEAAWGDTNHIIRISDEPAAWVILKPKAVAVAPVTISNGQVSTAARMVAAVSTAIGTEPTDKKGEFPQLVEMPGTPPAFEIHVPLIASLDALASQANKCCLPVSVPAAGKTLTLKKLELEEDGNKLVVGAKFSTGWFSSHGTLYLRGTPHLSADGNTLEIKDLAYDLRTERALLDGAAELAQPAVLEAISAKLRVDLRPLYDSALAQVRTRAANLAVADGVDVKTDITSVALDDVIVGDGKLVIIVAAKGSVRVEAK